MDITFDHNESSKYSKKSFRDILKLVYSVYHFVAKVFLYSILIILILVAVLFTFYFIDMIRNVKSGNPKSPLFGAYVIISPSMVPTIKVEDAIVIMRKEPDELKKGDIITFLSSDPRYSGLTITHRIVGIEKSEKGYFYRTKGDNNNTEDSALVSSDNVYGKVILKIPKIGYIQYVLTQAYGWVLLVVVPCLGIVIFDILKLIKTVRGQNSSNEDEHDNNKGDDNNSDDNNSDDIEMIGGPGDFVSDDKNKNINDDEDIEIL